MGGKYILALDQGTTSSRSILFDPNGHIAGSCSREFQQIYPQPGWVEHDPEAIWQTQRDTAFGVLQQTGVTAQDIAAIGITNQRETTLLWDKATGQPLYNAIVWQCRRTTDICEQLERDGLSEEFRNRTGLVVDAYFSGTKLKWLLDNIPDALDRAKRGELCFGTVDSWLLYKLTGRHATDYSNASRTLLFNIHDLKWDDYLLDRLGIPAGILPEVCPTSMVYGETREFGSPIPVASMAGDQQSALFGQTAFQPGSCKNTYGTGCFVLMNTGSAAPASRHGLLTTIAWGLGGKVEYALEGSVFIGGAIIQWLRDELRLIASASESESLAAQVPDSNGVHVVPAFVGLGAPYWDMRARGAILGLTRGANRAHLVRAALESISFQSADVLSAMQADTGNAIPVLKVDGGASNNNLLMQHQANILGIPVARGKVTETTALGAAFLAGLAVGTWNGPQDLESIWKEDRVFHPQWDEERRKTEMDGWRIAVSKVLSE
jgi:glycerol kinase